MIADWREPPDLDIYAGREPFEGRGIPEVPGTPDHAPGPEGPGRGRRARAKAAPAETTPTPAPVQAEFRWEAP